MRTTLSTTPDRLCHIPDRRRFRRVLPFPFVLALALVLAARSGWSNPPPSEWQLLPPVAAGQTSNGLYFPLQFSFDGAPAWDAANAAMTGTGGAAFAPAYASRHGFIDFGPDYDQVHIMETWTLYRTFSGGSHSGFPVMWWDDDTDNVNDDGVAETRLNFNSGQGVPHINAELWFRDSRANVLGGVIPQRRYLILQSSPAHTNRAEEFAMAGYLYDGLVPPEYANTLFLSIDNDSVPENGPRAQPVGTLSLSGGIPGISYSLTLVPGPADNAAFALDGMALGTRASFDFESKGRYTLAFDAIGSDGSHNPLGLEISVTDVSGKWDTNGPADAEVAAAYPEVNVGDFIVWGATNTQDSGIGYANGSLSVTPPNKILIKTGTYGKISLDLTGVAGTSAANRVPITNFLGQVYARQIDLIDGIYWCLTGMHDPAAGLGNADFPGCASPDGDTDFGYSNGRYGFWFSNEWENENDSMVHVGGEATGWEIDHIEVSDGGFAGMLLKRDSGTVDMDEVSLHHLYIHDTGSEGIYLGSTQADPQHQFNDLTIAHCLILRAGTEALQTGQLGANCLIRNCVVWGAMDWMSPFQRYQDNCVQVATRQGGTTFQNNILLGGGEKFYNVSNIPKAGIVPNGDPIVFERNVHWACRGPSGGYQFKNTDGVTPWIWRENFWGGFAFSYDRVYPGSTDSRCCVNVATDTVNVTATGSVFDTTRDKLIQNWASGSATIVQSGNVRKTVLPPRFLNLLGPGEPLDVLRWSRWTATIGEEPGFPSSGTNKGQPVVYQPGDIIQYPHAGRTRFYRCLQANSGHAPPDGGDAFWEWLTWEKDGRIQHSPPDDARLVEGSLYHQLGIGLRGNGLADSDSDGLPDDWELRHGLDAGSGLGNDGADVDPDGDSRTNRDEYHANTDPLRSDLFAGPVVGIAGDTIELSFRPPNGRAWRIEHTDFSDGWNTDGDWQPGAGQATSVSFPLGGDHRFFRLLVEDEASVLDLQP